MNGAAIIEPPSRSQLGFGGLVPTAAIARNETALVAALAVEHHTDGVAVPLLALSLTPGMLAWDVEEGLAATDDAGTTYRVRALSRQAGLGSLQVTAWLEPAVPASARTLTLTASAIHRVSSPRPGIGLERPLSGGIWRLEVDLLPPRTAVDAPPPPDAPRPGPASPRVPARALTGFRGLVPVGQARLVEGGAVCLWSIERYTDRAVLTVSVLRGAEGVGLGGHVRVWDDRGGQYDVVMLHETSRDGWTEGSVELVPALDPAAAALGVELSGLEPAGVMDGPFTFGIALPDVRE